MGVIVVFYVCFVGFLKRITLHLKVLTHKMEIHIQIFT